jgi:argininosuccinate lyase
VKKYIAALPTVASRWAWLRVTDLANLLVDTGVPFRESHQLAAQLVPDAERARVPLDRVSAALVTGIHPALATALTQLGAGRTRSRLVRRAAGGRGSRWRIRSRS